MANWPAEQPPSAAISAVVGELVKRGLSPSDIRIEHRFRDRLVFDAVCPCGNRFVCDVDYVATEPARGLDFAIEASWPRAHRACRPRLRPVPRLPDGPVRRATINQLRELQRDPFVRAAIAAFLAPARAHGQPSVPNVIGAVFPDGAVWRSGELREYSDDEIAQHEVARRSQYLGGPLPKAARAAWPRR